MVKDSSLVSVLGVADITQMGKVYAAGSFRFFETYSIVAYIYLDPDRRPVARLASAGAANALQPDHRAAALSRRRNRLSPGRVATPPMHVKRKGLRWKRSWKNLGIRPTSRFRSSRSV
jgi:hypothetical protein